MSTVFYCFLFVIISWNLKLSLTFIMKLDSNLNYLNNNMIQNQINSTIQAASSTAYSKQPILKPTSNLLMPFETPSLSNQLKQQFVLNKSNHNAFKNQNAIESTENKLQSDTYDSEDEEDFVHVTFDINQQAANLFKSLSSDTLKRLDDLGILSIQIDNDKPIKIKTKASNDQKVTVNSNYEIKQEKVNIITPTNNSNLSIPSPSPTSPFLIGQSPQKILINHPTLPSSPSPVLPPPPARKRNRKTINELTNHLSSNNSYSNYSQNETNLRPDDATIKAENSINKSTGQTKRKRTNKSNDNSLDNSNHDDNNEQKSSQNKANLGSDIRQVYIIDKNSPSFGTSSSEQSHSFTTSNNNSFITSYNSNLNNNSDIDTISNVQTVNNMNNSTIGNFSDHNNNFKDNQHQSQPLQHQQQAQQSHQQPVQQPHQLHQISQHHNDPNHQKQPFQMIQQQTQHQQYHVVNPQHPQQQNLQYQPQMFNNQQKMPQQPTQQYRMPSPMLANILSSNELNNNYTSQLNVSQIKNTHEIYLLNNNNPNLINNHENNMINKDNINENHTYNNNDNKQSLNELQLLKSEDYKQIYQMRQMLIANQQQNQHHIQHQHHQNLQTHQQQSQQQPQQQQHQYQQLQHQHPHLQQQQHLNQQVQQNLQSINQTQSMQQEQQIQNQSNNTTTTKRRRAPADPSKTRAKRTKAIAPNLQSTSQAVSNTNNLIILSSSDISKQTDSNQTQVITIHSNGEFNKNGDDKSNLSANLVDTKIKNYESFINQPTLEQCVTNNSEKFIDFSISNETKDKDISSNTTNLQDNKTKLELDDNISKISLQVIDPSSIYSNSQNQQSNLIYLNPTAGNTNDNVNKIKSLNFVSFKLNNTNNNTGPVSSAYSSSSQSTATQSSFVIANKQQQNIVFTNNNNNNNINNFTPNCVSSSSTASSSISCFNNYEFVNTTKSNSPIKELTSIASSNCSIQSNNSLQSINFKTDDETKQN